MLIKKSYYYRVSVFLSILFLYSCQPQPLPEAGIFIDSPNVQLDYGEAITQAEVAVYDAWYQALLSRENIYRLDSDSWADNHKEKWAWKGSYLMHGLLNMHRMTGITCPQQTSGNGVAYLEQFRQHSEFIFSRRNSIRTDSANDYLANKKIHAWPQKNNLDTGEKVYVANLVQTMMILDPIAEATHYIVKHPRLKNTMICNGDETWGDVANRWTLDILKTLDDFILLTSKTLGAGHPDVARAWVANGKLNGNQIIDNQVGWLLRYPDVTEFERLTNLFGNKAARKRGQEIPFNRAAVTAVVLANTLETLKLVNPSEYTLRESFYTEIIGNLLRSWSMDAQQYGAQGQYIKWHYTRADYNSRWEDIGHGGIDVRAFDRLLAMGYDSQDGEILLSHQLLASIANTFTESLYVAPGKVYEFVDGNGACDVDTKKMSRWLALAPYNRNHQIFDAIGENFVQGYSQGADYGFGFSQYLYVRGGCHANDTAQCQGYTEYPLQYKPAVFRQYQPYTSQAQNIAAPQCL